MLRHGVVPRLIVAQKVLDHIRDVASQFIEDETGESLIGLVLTPDDEAPNGTIVVLDTIAPDESVVRQAHMFEQGDTLQEDIFLWLSNNWNVYREQQREARGDDFKWDASLAHLGDWHKQPGFMIVPSGGDLRTVMQLLHDDDVTLDFMLVPIVTIGHPPTISPKNVGMMNYTLLPNGDDEHIRIDWWYIHRDSLYFQPIVPHIYKEGELPKLAPYPWSLTNYKRLNTEIEQLNVEGLFANVLELNVDNKLPIEICILCARKSSDKVYILTTRWNYPDVAPRFYVAPFSEMDSNLDMYDNFWRLWDVAEQLKPPRGWRWDKDTYLIDLIRIIEEKHNLLPEPEPKPVAESADTPNDVPESEASAQASDETPPEKVAVASQNDEAATKEPATDAEKPETAPQTEMEDDS